MAVDPQQPQTTDDPVADDPAGAYVSNQAGLRDLQSGNFQSALDHFRRASMVVPENAEYRNNYAIALLNLGRYTEAASELEYITTSIDPDRVVAHLDLANARLAAGDTNRALIALDRVRRLPADPSQRASAEQLIARIQAVRQAPAPPPPPPLDTRPSTPVPDTLLGQPRDTTTTSL
jgi:tetratricopeptide (TPR) repeat protein